MGTRADFYVGGTDPEAMQWIGSIAFDGYPEDEYGNGVPHWVLEVTNLDDYTEKLADFFADCSSFTDPEQGWPWPWEDSGTTDYAYTFVEGEGVRASSFGHAWFDPKTVPIMSEDEDYGDFEERLEAYSYAEPKVEFPDMTVVQNVTFGDRSGLIILNI